MANTLLTTSQITNRHLMVLQNKLTTAGQVTREYDDRFAVAGAKIGATVNVRKPPRYIGTTGPALNVEDTNETFIPVTLTTQFHVDTQFTTQDLTLSIDEYQDRIIMPAEATVANKIDRDGQVTLYQNIANAIGVPGNAPTSALSFLQAGAVLDSEAAPRDGQRAILLDPWTQASMADALKGLFNPQAAVAGMFQSGLLGKNTLGLDWYMDQNVVAYTVGAQGGSPQSASASPTPGLASGWASHYVLNTKGWSNGVNALNVGDVFTIAGVYAVNPQNRGVWGSNRLRQFVVLPSNGATAAQSTTYQGLGSPGTFTSGAGLLSVDIFPAPIYGGQFQNVFVAGGAGITASANITVVGTAGAVSPQNIVLHKNSFTLAMADLLMPTGVDMAARATDKNGGMTMRFVRQYTINNDALPARVDVLYGWAPLYPELACRVMG